MTTKEQVSERVIALLSQLASDWDYDAAIDGETYMFSELGFQSLDAVVLGNSLQEEYGQMIPYANLLTDIGQRSFTDVQVGEWIDFTYDHLIHEDRTIHET